MSELHKDHRSSLKRFPVIKSSPVCRQHPTRKHPINMSPLAMSPSPCNRGVPCKKRPWLPPSPSSVCSEDDSEVQQYHQEHNEVPDVGVPRVISNGSLPPQDAPVKQLSDFSIERILSDIPIAPRSGCAAVSSEAQQPTVLPLPDSTFEWLHCTRYRPPKLPRSRRRDLDGIGGVRRRRPGRGPRIPFAAWQIDLLEQRFQHGAYLGAGDVTSLANTLGLADARVKIWFQNRRARERRDGQNVSQLGTTRISESSGSSNLSVTKKPSLPSRTIGALGSTSGSAFTAIRPVNITATNPNSR